MPITVEATYENGVLKLDRPLPLSEHEKVRVTIELSASLARRTAGSLGWKGDAETLERFALDPEFDFPPSAEMP